GVARRNGPSSTGRPRERSYRRGGSASPAEDFRRALAEPGADRRLRRQGGPSQRVSDLRWGSGILAARHRPISSGHTSSGAAIRPQVSPGGQETDSRNRAEQQEGEPSMSRSQKWTPMLRGSAVFAALAIAQLSCSGTRPERKAETPSGAKVEAPAPAALTPDEGFRSQKPLPLQRVSPFQAPVPTERRLKNGLSVLVVENHEVALVSIEVMIKTGVNGEPVNKAGLSTLVASTLTEG